MLNDLLQKFGDLNALVQWAGYVGMAIIIFAETGLLIGIFLPGDSLLVTAGLLASQGYGDLNVWLLGLILNCAATAGNQTGYWIGRKVGPRIFVRDDSMFFKKKYVERAHKFYAKHGGKTIIIARFVPIVRTLAPVVAGVGQMNYRTFVLYDIVGGIGWVWSTLLAGYYLGRVFPGIEHNLEYVILFVVFLSILPAIFAWWKEKRSQPTAGVEPET
ncbi:MAG TPA: VTT domain-containing protein [Gemmatimonadaceae bacterium]|nr:VTT domain-containing protein [Gemmatimonadaceae bacterium]